MSEDWGAERFRASAGEWGRQIASAMSRTRRVEPEPPRFGPKDNSLREFERGYYRLARDLEYDGGRKCLADRWCFVARTKGGTALVGDVKGEGWVSFAALAAAGAERVEEDQR